MLKKTLFATTMLAMAPFAAQAQGALIDATDPSILAALIEGQGYPAEISVDNVGDPMIKSAANGYDFTVFFYDCTDHANCQAVQFSSSFDMPEGMSLTRAEDFNAQKRWGKVYLNDNSDPRLEMDYNLRGGVSVENFNDTLDWWVIVMGEFVDYIDF